MGMRGHDPRTLKRLNDAELIRRTRELVAGHNDIEADLIAYLGELERRKVYARKAYQSLFYFCRTELNFSEDVASTRIRVARAALKFPEILDALREGRVHLTGLRLLAPHLTPANCAALLAEASYKSRREIEEIVARIAPKPNPRDVIRLEGRGSGAQDPGRNSDSDGATGDPRRNGNHPAREQGGGHGKEQGQGGEPASSRAFGNRPAGPAGEGGSGAQPSPVSGRNGSPQRAGSPQPEPHRPHAPPRPPSIAPLSLDHFRLCATITRGCRDRMLRARDLASYRIPFGDLGELIDFGMVLTIEYLEKERFGVGRKPRTNAAPPEVPEAPESNGQANGQANGQPPGSGGTPREPNRQPVRDIPLAIKRAVYERDEGRCAFVDDEGRRCNATAFIELHHLDGFSYVREHDIDRIELRCRAHNQSEADEMFGRRFMDECRRSRR